MSTKTAHPMKSVTLHEMQQQFHEFETLNNAKLAKATSAWCEEVETILQGERVRSRSRLDAYTRAQRELVLALNDATLSIQRCRTRLDHATRRIAELEAQTFTGRLRRVRRAIRKMIDNFAHPFDLEDDELEPHVVDELVELYHAPGDFSRPSSLPLVRQDARHVR